ncbi:MAG: HPF/RaiA family ribosome-associated protein [Burkholderiales bacterium]
MQIQINTSNGIDNKESLESWATEEINKTLAHVVDEVTRIEVHLSDENSAKKHGGADKRCVMEARLARHQPVAVDHLAETLDQAFRGAEAKLKRVLESTLGRRSQHDRESIRKDGLLE